MPETSNIGPKIREFRKDRQLTIQELAQKAGLSPSYISQIETEKVSPSIATLKKIGTVLEVRTVDFFADELIEDPMILPPGLWTRVLLPGWEADVKQIVHIVGNKRRYP
jgi:transcriptional regulator with XRE-family HTH domain